MVWPVSKIVNHVANKLVRGPTRRRCMEPVWRGATMDMRMMPRVLFCRRSSRLGRRLTLSLSIPMGTETCTYSP